MAKRTAKQQRFVDAYWLDLYATQAAYVCLKSLTDNKKAALSGAARFAKTQRRMVDHFVGKLEKLSNN